MTALPFSPCSVQARAVVGTVAARGGDDLGTLSPTAPAASSDAAKPPTTQRISIAPPRPLGARSVAPAGAIQPERRGPEKSVSVPRARARRRRPDRPAGAPAG